MYLIMNVFNYVATTTIYTTDMKIALFGCQLTEFKVLISTISNTVNGHNFIN